MRDTLLKIEPIVYALTRIVSGFLFSIHGFQKLFGVLGGNIKPAWTQLWFGAVIEVVTGVLIAVGFFTRPAAVLASGTMAVAYFQFHVGGDFSNWHWLPAINKGELSAVYAFLFLLLACRGPGAFSLDRARGRDQ